MKRLLACLLGLCAIFALCACAKGGNAKGWTFEVNGVSMEIGGKCADALKKLESGCKGTSETGSCFGGKGSDVLYQYDGFRLKTNRAKAGDPDELLLEVEFTTDAVKTPEGITVGDTAEAVKAAYGTPDSESDSALAYVKGDTKLLFSLRSGKVSGVSYLYIQ